MNAFASFAFTLGIFPGLPHAYGAETIEQVAEKTRMKCANGSAEECRENIQALLSTYLDAVKGMKCG